MQTLYFVKELVNNPINDRNGVRIPFQHGADDLGYIEAEEGSTLALDLQKFASQRRGGVIQVDEKRFNDEAKKKPWSRIPSAHPAPRLFEPSKNPYKANPVGVSPVGQPAHLATGQAGAAPAVDANLAAGAVVPAASAKEKKQFKPRIGRTKPTES